MSVLPPEDRPPIRERAQSGQDWWYFAVIGAVGVLGLVFQALVFAQGRDDVWLGVIGGALVGIWMAAMKADSTDWQANPGPLDRGAQ